MVESGRTINASAWQVSGRLIARLFDFAVLIILARVLTPADFGLVALAMIPIYIGGTLFSLPIAQALIRVTQPAKSMYDTAFTLSFFKSIVLIIIFLLIAWPFSKFYGDSRLWPLICALSIVQIFYGIMSPRTVMFMKRLDFRREFIMDVTGKVCAFIVATAIALSTQSYWAIAAVTITAPLTMCIMSYILAPYRPRFTVSDWNLFKDMVGWHSLSQLISAINWQLSRILLGRFESTEVVGQYTLSDDLVSIPNVSILVPLERPLMANFVQKTSLPDLQTSYQLALNVLFTLFAPIYIVIFGLSDSIVYILLGENWLVAAPILKWLALVALIYLPVSTLSPLALSLDQTRQITINKATELIVKLPAMVIGVYLFGVWGAIAAVGIGAVAALLVSILSVRHLIGLSVNAQTSMLIRAIIASLAMAVVLEMTRPETLSGTTDAKLTVVADIALCGLASGATYLIVLFSLWAIAGRPAGFERQTLIYLSRLAAYRHKP